MFNIVKLINHGLKHYPIPTNAVIYGLMFAGADCLSQTLCKKVFATTHEHYDVENTKRCAVYGTLGEGPLLTLWYRWLDTTYPGIKGRTIAIKVFYDIFICAPIVYSVFFVSMSVMEGKDDIFQDLIIKLPGTFAASCVFWLPVQALNFKYISPVYRVTFLGITSFVWVTILCYIKSL